MFKEIGAEVGLGLNDLLHYLYHNPGITCVKIDWCWQFVLAWPLGTPKKRQGFGSRLSRVAVAEGCVGSGFVFDGFKKGFLFVVARRDERFLYDYKLVSSGSVLE
ncbi:uncharacterized protein PgNI_07468 [Pyricularia grisea]|uniref:Uncharacterized protein n=1 Tax=Pyricularia grisea TaxID=148305 RepID=A0A6P8B2Q0_PYRGI|nr:uncharacterized protein PgNI_07468 [Pyricularia grisea]TLD08983.1 hypothetical protein PgNI_07468 [Pyricularia grisea]